MSERVCVLCGGPLDGQRAQARHCGPACRREAARLRALLAGQEVNGYRCLTDYLASPHKRAKSLWRAAEELRATR